MVPEKSANFYNVTLTFKVHTSTDTNDNLSVSIVYKLSSGNSGTTWRSSTASRGAWHPTYIQEPALREHLANELFNNRTVLVR
jgi:hypothetical protein